MASPDYDKNKQEAELIEELSRVVKHQIYGRMDWVRARAYWRTRLPHLDTELLAEALTYALIEAKSHLINRSDY